MNSFLYRYARYIILSFFLVSFYCSLAVAQNERASAFRAVALSIFGIRPKIENAVIAVFRRSMTELVLHGSSRGLRFESSRFCCVFSWIPGLVCCSHKTFPGKEGGRKSDGVGDRDLNAVARRTPHCSRPMPAFPQLYIRSFQCRRSAQSELYAGGFLCCQFWREAGAG